MLSLPYQAPTKVEDGNREQKKLQEPTNSPVASELTNNLNFYRTSRKVLHVSPPVQLLERWSDNFFIAQTDSSEVCYDRSVSPHNQLETYYKPIPSVCFFLTEKQEKEGDTRHNWFFTRRILCEYATEQKSSCIWRTEWLLEAWSDGWSSSVSVCDEL